MITENHCLYCQDPPNSLEHPLPAAFGEFENAPLLENRICKPCNEKRLGVLDEQFARSGPEAFLRKFYGIKGRHGHEPVNPFYRGSAGGQRLEMKSYDENLGMEVLLEVENGEARQMRQLIFVKDGQPHHLPVREGTTPEQLRAAYDKLAITKPEDVHFICDEQEMKWVGPLMQAAWPSTTSGVTGEAARTYNGAVVEVRLTNRYFRAVAKIGFHYLLTQFTLHAGREPMFADIREYILDENHKVERANDYVGERQLPLIGEMLPAGTRPQGWRGHVLTAEIKNGVCLAHVQMFLSEEFPARTYTVKLAQAEDIPDGGSGHLYAYYKDGLHGQYAGEAHRLEWTRIDLAPMALRPAVMTQ